MFGPHECGLERLVATTVPRQKGEMGWTMTQLPSNPDRDFSANQSEDDIHAEIAELFASRTQGMLELFVEPAVRMRVGML